MTMDGEFRLVGFYTTRWVEAGTAEEAELQALQMLRAEYQFSHEEKQKAPEARVYFEEVLEVPSDTRRVPPNSGATWFSMDED